jgi:tetratricopeptide (TPR) repeat protein
MPTYIQRDRSSLADGALFGRKKTAFINWKFAVWLFAMTCVAVVIWQFNAIQPHVLAMVGQAPTATPFPIVYAQQADHAYWNGDLTNAILNYRQALALDPSNINYRYELVRVLVYHSYEDRRNAVDLDNSSPDGAGRERLPIYTQNNGPMQGALQIAEQAIVIAPANARAYAMLCFARMADNKSEDALRACLRAQELDPNDPDTYAFQAYAQFDLQRYDTAQDSANKAVTDAQQFGHPSIDAYISLGQVFGYKGRLAQAQTAYISAMNINPKLEFPYFAFAGYELSLQNDKDLVRAQAAINTAIETYRRVLENNPHSVKAYTRLCAAYFNLGDFTSASDNCDAALQIDPTYLDAIAMKGQVQYRGRDYEDAIDTLEGCVTRETQEFQKNPNFQRSEECWLYLGLSKYTLGRCVADEKDRNNPEGATKIFTDLLDWAQTDVIIRTARDGINRCAYAFNGQYSTPTPRPSPTIPPTPILPGG